MSSGCRILLIIGIVIGVIIIVGIILSYVFCGQIQEALVGKTVDALQAQVLKDLPEGYDADSVKVKFAEFKKAVQQQIKNKTLNQGEIQQLSTEVQDALKDDKIDKEELDKIMKLIQDVIKTE